MSSTLRVDHITVAYGNMPAVRDVSLTVGPGELVALLGRNGAGKTTTLRAIAGLQRVRLGTITLGDTRLSNRPGWQVARAGIAMVLEGGRVFGEQTVAENLALGIHAGRDHVASRIRVEEVLESLPALRAKWSMHAALLSGGERQQLAIAQALAALPVVLLLDEPSVGLAPVVVAELFMLLHRIRTQEGGPSMLVAEQMVAPVLRVADRAVVVDGGRVATAGPAAQLRESPELLDTYMGRPARS